MGKFWEVGACSVVIGCIVYEAYGRDLVMTSCEILVGALTKVKNELSNLEASDPLLPPDTNAACCLKVVPVHDNVDRKIESNWNP